MSGDPLGILTPKKQTSNNDPLGILTTPKKEQPTVPTFMDVAGQTQQTIQTAKQNVPKPVYEKPKPTTGEKVGDIMGKYGITPPMTEQQSVVQYGGKIGESLIKQRDEAIENTIQYRNNKLGIKTDTSSVKYKNDVKKLRDQFNEGEFVKAEGKNGKQYVVPGAGFWESAGMALAESFKAPVQAWKINTLEGKDLADYLDRLQRDEPFLPQKKPSGVAGAFGETAGGFPKFAAIMSAGNAIAPMMGTGLVGAEAEFVSTAMYTRDLYQRNLQKLLDEGIPVEEARLQAADKAKKDAPVIAMPDAAMAVGLGVNLNPTRQVAAETFKKLLVKEAAHATKIGLAGGGAELAKVGTEVAMGYDVTPNEALERFADATFEWATMDAMFKVLPLMRKMPGALKASYKEYLRTIPREVIEQQAAEKNVPIEEIDAELNSYEAARSKVADIVPEESVSTFAGLTEKQDKLKSEISELESKKAVTPEGLHPQIEKEIEVRKSEIESINKQIADIAEKADAEKIDIDRRTGEPEIKKPEEISQPIELEVETPKVETATPEQGSIDTSLVLKDEGNDSVGGNVELKKGNKIQWDVFGNEESGEWTVGEKTKTRGGKDAVVLSKVYVESSSDGKRYTKEYADANGIKYDNERIVEHIVPLEDLQSIKQPTPQVKTPIPVSEQQPTVSTETTATEVEQPIKQEKVKVEKSNVLTLKDFDEEGDLTDEGFEKATNILSNIINNVAQKYNIPNEQLLSHYNIKNGEYRSSLKGIMDMGESQDYGKTIKLVKDIAFKMFPDKIDELNEQINIHSDELLNALENDTPFEVNKSIGKVVQALNEIDNTWNEAKKTQQESLVETIPSITPTTTETLPLSESVETEQPTTTTTVSESEPTPITETPKVESKEVTTQQPDITVTEPTKEYTEKGLKINEAKKVYASVKEIDDPTDARGLALQYIAGGGKIGEKTLFKEVQARRDERFAKQSKAEKTARDYVEKDGKTIEQISHSIWDNLPDYLQESISAQDVRNELIDVVGSYNKRIDAAKEFVDKYHPEKVAARFTEDADLEYFQKKYAEEIEAEEREMKKWLESEAETQYEIEQSDEYINHLINLYEQEFEKENQQPTAAGKRETNQEISNRKNIEEKERAVKAAESEYESAQKELSKAEDKVAKKQATQQSLMPTEGVQKEMFGVSGDEAKKILDPLRKKVKESKSKLDKLKNELLVEKDKANTSLFTEPTTTQPIVEEVKSDLGTKARNLAAKVRSGEKQVLPDWLQASLPKGTKKQGIDINEAFAKALETFADIYDTTKDFAQAVEQGFKNIKDWFDENKIPYNEAELKQKFAQDRQAATEETQTPPIPPIPPVSEGEGETGFRHADTEKIRAAANIEEYKRTPEKIQDWIDEAAKLVREGYDVQKLLNRVEKGYMPDKVEQNIIGQYILFLNEKLTNNPNDEKTLSELKRAVEISDRVGGSEIAKSLVSRRGARLPDESLGAYFIEQMETSGTGTLTEEQKSVNQKEFEEITKANDEYKSKVKVLEDEVAKLKAEKEYAKEKSKAKKTKKTHDEYVKERKDILKQMREDLLKVAKGEGGLQASIPGAAQLRAIAPHVAKLVKSFAEEGIDKLDNVVSSVYNELKDVVEGITEKDIHNIIAGEYNKEVKQTRSQLAATLRDLKTEARLINELEKLQSGVQPKTEKAKIERNRRITDLQSQIKELKKQQAVREKEYDTFYAEDFDADFKKLESLRKRTETEIAKVQDKINKGEYAPEPQKPLLLNPELKKKYPEKFKQAVDAKDKLIKLKQEREIRLLKEKYANRTKYQKFQDAVVEISNVPRARMASVDFSAPLRQGIITTVGYPKISAGAFVEMFKQAFSQKRFDRWFYDVKEHPRYELAQKSTLHLSDPLDPKLTAKEEQFMTNLAEKIPILGKLVKGSERAYLAYLNKVRWDVFNRMADAYESEGKTFENSEKLYRETGDYINTVTGRGTLGKFEESAQVLNAAFFSPRLIASRLKLLTNFANPNFYYNVPKEVRVQYFKDMAKFIGAGLTVLTLAKLYQEAFGSDDEDEKVTVEGCWYSN